MKTLDKLSMDSKCWWSCNAGKGFVMLGPLTLTWYAWLNLRHLELYWRDRLLVSR